MRETKIKVSNEIANELKTQREYLKLSQKSIADSVGISKQQYQRIESKTTKTVERR